MTGRSHRTTHVRIIDASRQLGAGDGKRMMSVVLRLFDDIRSFYKTMDAFHECRGRAPLHDRHQYGIY